MEALTTKLEAYETYDEKRACVAQLVRAQTARDVTTAVDELTADQDYLQQTAPDFEWKFVTEQGQHFMNLSQLVWGRHRSTTITGHRAPPSLYTQLEKSVDTYLGFDTTRRSYSGSPQLAALDMVSNSVNYYAHEPPGARIFIQGALHAVTLRSFARAYACQKDGYWCFDRTEDVIKALQTMHSFTIADPEFNPNDVGFRETRASEVGRFSRMVVGRAIRNNSGSDDLQATLNGGCDTLRVYDAITTEKVLQKYCIIPKDMEG